MKYEVDKKSFYEMLVKILNSIFGDDYVVLQKDCFRDCKIINDNFYHYQINTYFLEDNAGRKLFESESTIFPKRVSNYRNFKENILGNDSFIVSEETNEILDLIYPYILEYPFLDIIPSIVDGLVMNRYDGKNFTFKNSEIEAICLSINEYVKLDEKVRNDTKYKILLKVKEYE